MNEPNPYSPPGSPVADVGAPELHTSRLRVPRYVLGALVLLQFLATWGYASAYFELTRAGAVSFIVFLGTALGNCACTVLPFLRFVSALAARRYSSSAQSCSACPHSAGAGLMRGRG
jgi:hypothetical protein